MLCALLILLLAGALEVWAVPSPEQAIGKLVFELPPGHTFDSLTGIITLVNPAVENKSTMTYQFGNLHFTVGFQTDARNMPQVFCNSSQYNAGGVVPSHTNGRWTVVDKGIYPDDLYKGGIQVTFLVKDGKIDAFAWGRNSASAMNQHHLCSIALGSLSSTTPQKVIVATNTLHHIAQEAGAGATLASLYFTAGSTTNAVVDPEPQLLQNATYYAERAGTWPRRFRQSARSSDGALRLINRSRYTTLSGTVVTLPPPRR